MTIEKTEAELNESDKEESESQQALNKDSDSELSLDNKEVAEISAEEDRAAEANLLAAGDQISRTISDVKLDQRVFVVYFGKEYTFSGKKYRKLDLSALDDLTTIDLQRVDRICEQMNVHMDDKLNDTLWCKYIAIAASGLPIEFFNQLKARDMMEISGLVRFFFTLG